MHRSVTLDPDIYQRLKSEVEFLQVLGLQAKVSDVLNCRLLKDYTREPRNLILEDLDWAKREKQEAVKRSNLPSLLTSDLKQQKTGN